MSLLNRFSRQKDSGPDLAQYVPSKSKTLKALIDAGAPVDTVIDVGVQNMTQELIDLFGDKQQILCEPISEYYDVISNHYGAHGVNFEIEASAMSNADGPVELELSSVIDGLDITHARITNGEGTEGTVRRQVTGKRVDTMVSERGLAGPFLLKIDVDGAEVMVLEGAKNTLPNCCAVIIEVQANNLFERAAPILAAGFELFDIVDLCFYEDRMAQVDLVFANPKFFEPHALDVVKAEFDYSKWIDLSHIAKGPDPA